MNKRLFFRNFSLVWLFIFAVLTFTACEKDDDNDNGGDTPLVEDGFYVVGEATPFSEIDPQGALMTTKNEVIQEERSELREIYIALKAGADFNIKSVAGADQKTWGPGADFALVAEDDLDAEEPQEGLWRGTLEVTENAFSVPEDGLYHVVMDTELGKVAVARVIWGAIGAATPNGWGGSTELPSQGFDQQSMTFEATDVVMVVGDYKFRYSDGWKIVLDSEYDLGGGDKGIKVNCNFGGSLSNLETGGDNISNDENGLFTVNVTWSLTDGTSATVTKTGEYTPPAFPDAMYLVGNATEYGWDEPGTVDDAIMHKADGGSPTEGLFWKIAHLHADSSFKLAAEAWGDPNLGYGGIDEFDADGVTVSDDGDGNMSVSTSNVYMIVLDLRDDAVKLSIKEAEVYGIGDAFGGWDEDVEANKFTIDLPNKAVISPALPADGTIRTYAQHAWIPDWWNAEFVPNAGDIEYRNDSGADPTAIAGSTGEVITYYFDTNTSKVE